MLTLFHAPGTCSLASLITLEHVGAAFTLRKLDFSRNEQRSPEYLALNPNGRVPALQTPRGVLTETPAILLYLAQTHPAASLAPLDNSFALAHAHRFRGSRWADDPAAIEAMKQKVPQSVGACFALVEGLLPVDGWIFGAQPGVSDFYLFTVAQWLEGDGLDPTAYPKVIAHRERVRALPAVQKALAA
ncbi:MAG: glutathione S-transferase [Candidatus Dactylopiibacterium carminicum]|uniref:Glutathione S-transferase n=1 Tax=Candidatus Dactylopiibacterium carminicum TaxID=857335 RepID=A0A272EZ40_9RHOO|nr:glutathione S-transferase family protein [Candidatus Dactylopiibacterium carminicum]KAF7600856.1 glutathione S-transferase family protein [Candidatus Dactylopiibacterium carminicum]PAS95355.1 MAG: glutathione S-transferase [Candidatus Dactylopiibacterium carminicum]PAS98722.1 MAG: glutathione S-transferase [Candidatus Dactylopiibacterium carminicum]PAT00858.1 MAG: glutathione S-transferase [Candidatus Dactylopiibacterium carminicum]